ncbi:MAG: SDR family oxidoreductase [Pirellulaceae bacterium]
MSSSSAPVALVTGGAVRLGRSLAVALAHDGFDIVVHYHSSASEANAVCGEISAIGRRAVALAADLAAGEAAVDELWQGVAPWGDAPCLLVNSAAIFASESLQEFSSSRFAQHIAINLQAPLLLSRRFARDLSWAEGQIINIVDWRGLHPQPGHLSYTLAKAGLVAATRLLARELAPRIRVNAIAPGAILPPPGADRSYLEAIAEQVPLQRTGSPKDIVDAMLYLAHAPFVTGQILEVTGGQIR